MRGSGILLKAALSGRPRLQFPVRRRKALGGLTVILKVSTNKTLIPLVNHIPLHQFDPAKGSAFAAYLARGRALQIRRSHSGSVNLH